MRVAAGLLRTGSVRCEREASDHRHFRTRDRPGINGIRHIPAGCGFFPSRIIGPGQNQNKPFLNGADALSVMNDASRGSLRIARAVKRARSLARLPRASRRAPCCGSPRPLAGNPNISPSETRGRAFPVRPDDALISSHASCASGVKGRARARASLGLAGVRSRPNGSGLTPRSIDRTVAPRGDTPLTLCNLKTYVS